MPTSTNAAPESDGDLLSILELLQFSSIEAVNALLMRCGAGVWVLRLADRGKDLHWPTGMVASELVDRPVKDTRTKVEVVDLNLGR
ncbi:hypothetical protein SDJN03_21159, partial [Cucurbita argyrosperma subsp. sororia]